MFGRKKVETPCFGMLAEFPDGDSLLSAIHSARAQGYEKMEAYTPLPMHDVCHALGDKNRLPWLVLVGGIVAWLGAGAGRKRARDARHKAEEAERKVKRLEQELSVARSAQAGSSQANAEQRAIGQQQALPARIEDDTADKDKDRAAA